jgi:8-oxo-dGTP pyrophosphatase MutT (NUDIX family)
MPMSEHLQRIRQKVGHDMLVLPSAAVAIHDNENRLLLGLHAEKKLWVLPGGLIEVGELPADGAVREVWEEMGVVVELTGILGIYGGETLVIQYSNGDRASYVTVLFSGRIASGKLSVDGQEILEAQYFSRGELNAIPHPRWVDLAMPALFSKDNPVHFQQTTWNPKQAI